MIYSVRGKLIAKEINLAVVECGGVGYACRTTTLTLSRLDSVGSEVFLYTYLNIREDCAELFGFHTKEELSCFKMLISVSGVGPKAAISILSDIEPSRFALCVTSGDSKAFTKVKGIGAKTAQRIVLELKDKIAKEGISVEGGFMPSFDMGDATDSSAYGEAISALVVLGYSQSDAAKVVSKLDEGLSSSEMIRLALKAIGSKM